jgi:rare lipoprotein A
MKRWLIGVSLLVAGLLMVGWGGDALAARHPPSLLQKILAMFAPNKSPETGQTPPSVASVQSVETAYALQAVESAEPAQAAPTARPEPVQTTREKKGDRLKPMQLVQTGHEVKAAESVRAKPAAEKTWALASLESVPVPVRSTTPATSVQTGTILTTAEPPQAKPAAQPIRKPGKAQPADSAQSAPPRRPVQVAILGAPNLGAVLPAETSPEAQPTDEPRPTAKPGAKSTCNSGQRIVSAYYWEGRRTASGEPFNPRGMTAAHRTLPFGTHLNVTNPRTGKTVDVVVNDRGPYVHGVSLDLSLGAAQAIGLQGTGSVCVL